MDSPSAYFHDSRQLVEIGLVRVGEAYAVRP
jgi:hypothetical protein